MAKLDKEEISKLSPEEKIKRLKEIAEADKKEIKEAEELIKATESEIKREKIAESVAVPETKPVDISELFAPAESALEQAAQEAKEEITEENVRYFVQHAYEGVKEALGGGEVDMEAIDAIGEKLEKVKYFHPSDEISELAVAAQYMIHKVRKDIDDA